MKYINEYNLCISINKQHNYLIINDNNLCINTIASSLMNNIFVLTMLLLFISNVYKI